MDKNKYDQETEKPIKISKSKVIRDYIEVKNNVQVFGDGVNTNKLISTRGYKGVIKYRVSKFYLVYNKNLKKPKYRKKCNQTDRQSVKLIYIIIGFTCVLEQYYQISAQVD